MHGEYALTRYRDGRGGEREAWLLVRSGKGRAHGHGTPDPHRARSVRSGRALAQVAADGDEE